MKKHFGILSIELKWFESYLSNRKQQCRINGQLSSKKSITCGVPLSSILGPLLFLLYFNDLPECLRSTTPCMYADDTQIFSSSYYANELVIKLNSDLAHVRNWLEENKLHSCTLLSLNWCFLASRTTWAITIPNTPARCGKQHTNITNWYAEMLRSPGRWKTHLG